MKKGRAIAALFANILILGAVIFAVLNMIVGFVGNTKVANPADAFTLLHVDMGIVLAISAVVSLIADIACLAGKKARAFPVIFKAIAVAGALVATVFYLVVVGILGKAMNQFIGIESGLWLCLIAPLLGVCSIILENKPRVNWANAFFALIPVGAYVAFTLIGTLGQIGINCNPYGIYTFAGEYVVRNIVVLIALFVLAFLFAWILILLRRIGDQEAVEAAPVAEAPAEEAPAEEPAPEEAAEQPAQEEEPAPAEEAAPVEEAKPEEPAQEEAPAEEAKPEEPAEEPAPAPAPAPAEPKAEQPKPAPKPVAKKTLNPRPAAKPAAKPVAKKPAAKPAPAPVATASGGPRVYHIAKHPSGQWSVKLASSDKVIKLFRTQAEAIDYAKSLVESRGGSYRIHSVKGKLRKE